MTLKAGRVRFTFDYISVACVCLSVVVFGGRFAQALFCAMVHEAGHILVLLSAPCDPHNAGGGELEIILRCFGADIVDKRKSTRSYRTQAAVSVSGPLTNFLLALVLLPMRDLPVVCECIIISTAMGAFNLLPVVSTDGGELATIALLHFFTEKTARRVIFALTALLLIPVFSAALYILLRQKNNYTLLVFSMAIIANMLKD